MICYNGTHLGLGMAMAKCTLIKRGPPNSKSPSISAIPPAELALPSSPYTVSGQIFSLDPISGDAAKWAWTGEFVSLSLKCFSHLKNLRFAVSSRLIDPMHGRPPPMASTGLLLLPRRTKHGSFEVSISWPLGIVSGLGCFPTSSYITNSLISQVFLRDFPPIKRRL